MILRASPALLLCAFAASADPVEKLKADLGPAARAVMAGADRVEMFRLDPSKPPEPGGREVAGVRAVGRSGDAQRDFVARLWKTILDGQSDIAPPDSDREFRPNVGLRVWDGEDSVDLVLSFESDELEFEADGRRVRRRFDAFRPALVALVQEGAPGDVGVKALKGWLDEMPEATGKALGKHATAVLESPERAEVFRIQPERAVDAGARSVAGHPIVAASGERTAACAARTVGLFRAGRIVPAAGDPAEAKPGLLFRIYGGGGSVDMLLDLSTNALVSETLPPLAADFFRARFDASGARAELLELARQAFPGDEELREMK